MGKGRERAWCPEEDNASSRNMRRSTGKDSVFALKMETRRESRVGESGIRGGKGE